MEDDLYDRHQAAVILGRTKKSVIDLQRAGLLRSVRPSDGRRGGDVQGVKLQQFTPRALAAAVVVDFCRKQLAWDQGSIVALQEVVGSYPSDAIHQLWWVEYPDHDVHDREKVEAPWVFDILSELGIKNRRQRDRKVKRLERVERWVNQLLEEIGQGKVRTLEPPCWASEDRAH